MSIFGKTYNFQQDAIPPEKNRFSALARLVKPGAATVRAPEMKGGTSIVILPYPNFENPNYKRENDVVPDRSEETRFSPGVFFYADGVNKFGKSPVSLLFNNPDDAGFSPEEHHPAHMIYSVLMKTVKNKALVTTPFGTSDSDKWGVLLDGDGGNVYGCIKRPGRQFLVNALVYTSGADNYVLDGSPPLGAADDDKQVVFVMTQATFMDFLDKIDVLDAKEAFLHPEITGCKFVHIFDKKVGTCPAMQGAEAAKRAATGMGGVRRAPVGTPGQKKMEGFGFGVYVSDTLSGRPAGPQDPPALRTEAAQLACAKLKPWDQVLREYTPEECARIISDECSLPDSLLYHAWKNRPEFYSDALKLRLKNPKSVNFPPAPAANAAAPPQDAPDGAHQVPDGTEQNTIGDMPDLNGPTDTDDQTADLYDPTKIEEAHRMFRQKMMDQGAQSRPGGTKPPSRR